MLSLVTSYRVLCWRVVACRCVTRPCCLQVRNPASNLCIDTKHKGANEAFGLDRCNKDTPVGGEQVCCDVISQQLLHAYVGVPIHVIAVALSFIDVALC